MRGKRWKKCAAKLACLANRTPAATNTLVLKLLAVVPAVPVEYSFTACVDVAAGS